MKAHIISYVSDGMTAWRLMKHTRSLCTRSAVADFTHLDKERNTPTMVDISSKQATHRTAHARLLIVNTISIILHESIFT
jgi:hypothetical protein